MLSARAAEWAAVGQGKTYALHNGRESIHVGSERAHTTLSAGAAVWAEAEQRRTYELSKTRAGKAPRWQHKGMHNAQRDSCGGGRGGAAQDLPPVQYKGRESNHVGSTRACAMLSATAAVWVGAEQRRTYLLSNTRAA